MVLNSLCHAKKPWNVVRSCLLLVGFIFLAPNIYSATPRQRLQEAKLAVVKANYKLAIEILVPLSHEYPQNRNIKVLLAKSYARMQEYRLSYEAFRSAGVRKIHPSFAFELGVAFFYHGLCKKALHAFKLVQVGSQDKSASNTYVAVCYAKFKEWERAENILAKEKHSDQSLENLRLLTLAKVQRAKNRKSVKYAENVRKKTKDKKRKNLLSNSHSDLLPLPSRSSSLQGGQTSTKSTYMSRFQSNARQQYSLLDASIISPFTINDSVFSYFGGNAGGKRSWLLEQYASQTADVDAPPTKKAVFDEMTGKVEVGASLTRSGIARFGSQIDRFVARKSNDPGYQSYKNMIEWEDQTLNIARRISLSQNRITFQAPPQENEEEIQPMSALLNRSIEGNLSYLSKEYSADLLLVATQSQTEKELVDPQVVTLDSFYGEIYETKTSMQRSWSASSILFAISWTRYVLHLLETAKLEEESRFGLNLEWSMVQSWASTVTLSIKREWLLGFRSLVETEAGSEEVIVVDGVLNGVQASYVQPIGSIFELELRVSYDQYSWPEVNDRFRSSFEDQVPKDILESDFVLRASWEF